MARNGRATNRSMGRFVDSLSNLRKWLKPGSKLPDLLMLPREDAWQWIRWGYSLPNGDDGGASHAVHECFGQRCWDSGWEKRRPLGLGDELLLVQAYDAEDVEPDGRVKLIRCHVWFLVSNRRINRRDRAAARNAAQKAAP